MSDLEIAYQRLTDLLKKRARMFDEMHDLVVRALALTKVGKDKQARVLLRKAESLKKKLWPSSKRR
jgi:signal transduction histidine kinase